MKPAELRTLLEQIYRDKLAMRHRHEAGARFVSTYEANNAYQYILAREDLHLAWLRTALESLGGEAPEPGPVPDPPGGSSAEARQRAILQDDIERARAFVERWRGPVDGVTHARHRQMLRVILGETMEHQRLLEQSLAGRRDVLGRREVVDAAAGRVLPTRWVE